MRKSDTAGHIKPYSIIRLSSHECITFIVVHLDPNSRSLLFGHEAVDPLIPGDPLTIPAVRFTKGKHELPINQYQTERAKDNERVPVYT